MNKPNNIKQISVRWNLFLPFHGFFAMTLFGKMWIRKSNRDKWSFYERTGKANIMKNHEMIHVKQAVSTGNSWLKFYLKYIFEWIKCIPIINGFNFSYFMNSFELEAYGNESDMTYSTVNFDGATEWKKYARLSNKKRKELWKIYKSKKHMSFSNFVRNYVKQEIGKK